VVALALAQLAEQLPEAGHRIADASGASACGAIVYSMLMACGVMPSTSQRRESPRPTSIVTTRWLADSGSAATWRITLSVAVPLRRAPAAERLNSQSASGIAAMIAMNHRVDVSAVAAMVVLQARLRRRMRSLGVTMSVRRIPNLSFTTTTSPCAIR